MISCTEFIPAYSELFKFLHHKAGRPAVDQFWNALSDHFLTNLRDVVQANGLAGCFDYWSQTLTEEAADFKMTLDEKNNTFEIHMRHCPSKGRLLEYTHIEPYPDYCEHCDTLYRRVLEPLGFEYQLDLTRCDQAECKLIILPKTQKQEPPNE